MEYIIIYLNCGQERRSFRIDLTSYTDFWDINRFRSNQISPYTISEIFIGPKTAIEMFNLPYFNGNSTKIVNHSPNEGKIYKFGCPGRFWRPKIRSLIIWTYDKYMQLFGPRYCSTDLNCGEFENCLCLNGQAHPSWCPISKRRCMNRGYFVNDQPVPIADWGNTDVTCFENLLNNIRQTNGKYEYSVELIRDIMARCNPTRNRIECFDDGKQMYPISKTNAVISILAIMLIFYLFSL